MSPRDPSASELGKICYNCQKWKPREEFGSYKYVWHGMISNCRECCNKISREKRKAGTAKPDKNKQDYKDRRKAKVISQYTNGIMGCVLCGFSDIRALQIDHIDGNGKEHRKQIGNQNILNWLIQNNYPDGFRVLCANCNRLEFLRMNGYGEGEE